MPHSAAFPTSVLNAHARNILEHGVFVIKTDFYQIEVSLYKMDDVYVEVWYDTERESITQIENLKGRNINPYLKHFSQPSLN